MLKKAFPRWAVVLFFAAFLLFGLFTAADYGAPWDEQDEMDILRMNLWEYARAFGLDESAFEKRAALGSDLTISVLTPISESIEQDHGIAAFYPMVGVVMSNQYFTGPAVEAAKKLKIVLWDRGYMEEMMAEVDE